MTGDPGPEQQPEKLTPDSPDATKAETAEDGGPSLLARIPGAGLLARIPGGRTLLTVLAAVVAVCAIAATTWALARSGGDETATPVEQESGTMSFAPNQPDATSSTSLPTLPTFPTLPTTPSIPTSSVTFPSATLPATTLPTFPTRTTPPVPVPSYTPPTFPTPTYTPPTFPTPSTPTQTSTGPSKTTVVPVPPVAKKISSCGTYGSLKYVRTPGVKYSLVVGDGKKGRYVVTARARKGYVIAKGAQKRFAGRLGQYRECPLGIRKVAVTKADPGWNLRLRLWVPEEDRDRALSVTFLFLERPTLDSWNQKDGWTCQPIVENSLGCAYQGGGKPPALKVRLLAGKGGPAGTVGLFADDEQTDATSFGG